MNGKKIIQIFPTRMYNVTAWRHSRLRAHWLMALVGGGGGLKEKYVFCVPRELQRLLSLFCLWEESVGRSLTAGKILFTGRQTCSLYLVLWLCDTQTCLYLMNTDQCSCVFTGLWLENSIVLSIQIKIIINSWIKLMLFAREDK